MFKTPWGEVYSHPVSLDFSANINPLGTPEAVQQAVINSLPLLFQYPDPYCRELVAAIARHEGVNEDTILCGNGAAELIFALCSALKPKRRCCPCPPFRSTVPPFPVRIAAWNITPWGKRTISP